MVGQHARATVAPRAFARWPSTAMMAALVAIALSGCVGVDGSSEAQEGRSGGNSTAAGTAGEPAQEPAPTEQTGSLRALVVDDEGKPVSAAQVAVVDVGAAFSDTRGVAVFNELAPDTYTVLASKPGFRAAPESGVLVKVVAGATADVLVEMRAVLVVTVENSYHKTFPMRGFIACDGYVSPIGDLHSCADGVNVGGTTYLRDPNDNSTHPWEIDSPAVTGITNELLWTETNEALGDGLRFWIYGYKTCATTCSYSQTLGGAGGNQEVRFELHEGGDDKNITGRLGDDPEYPHSMAVEVWPTITTRPGGLNVGVSVYYQQGYDMYLTGFYGQPMPSGFQAAA